MPENKQNIPKKFGGCLLALFVWIRGFRLSPLFALINVFSTYCLIVFLVVAVFRIGLNWRLIIILPLGFLIGFLLPSLSVVFLAVKNYGEIQEFLVKFNHCEFTRVSVEDFVRVVKDGDAVPEDENRSALYRSKLSDTEFFLGNHIRFIVVDEGDSDGPSLGTAVAYYLAEGSWIFLKEPPEDMTDIQKFIVLHEIGHTETLANIIGDYKGANIYIMLSLPLAAALTGWTLTAGIIYAVIFLVLIWRYLHGRYVEKFLRFHDEVYADFFAFARAKKEWFGGFTAEKIADVYCNSMQSNKADGLVKTDKPMTVEQAAARRKIFINNIERLRKGEPISNDDLLGVYPFDKIKAIDSVHAVLLGTLFVMLGFQTADLTTVRLLIFIVLAVFLIILLVSAIGIPAIYARNIDYEFGYKKKEEFSEGERKQLDNFYKYGNKFSEVKEKMASKAKIFRNDEDQEYIPADGTTDRLFLSGELYIEVEFKPLKTCIYHVKKIDYDISHLFYVPESHSVVVVKKDNSRLDLGCKLEDNVRPYFLKSTKVTIIRTEDGEEVESLTVPFHNVD